MDERLKNLLYMAVGLASTSKKVKLLLDKIQVEGQLTEEEGKRIINEIVAVTGQTSVNVKEEISQYITNIFNELQTPTKKEHDHLAERIAKLEEELTMLKKSFTDNENKAH